jgi:hypothetical protein
MAPVTAVVTGPVPLPCTCVPLYRPCRASRPHGAWPRGLAPVPLQYFPIRDILWVLDAHRADTRKGSAPGQLNRCLTHPQGNTTTGHGILVRWQRHRGTREAERSREKQREGTMMTTAQYLMILRAAERAQRQGLRITTFGWVRDHRAFWVTSASRPGHEYLVEVLDHTLTCTCQAYLEGQYCKHRALVHLELVREKQAAEVARVAAEAPAIAPEPANGHTCPLCGDPDHISEEAQHREVGEDRWSLTPKGQALALWLQECREKAERTERRTTAEAADPASRPA